MKLAQARLFCRSFSHPALFALVVLAPACAAVRPVSLAPRAPAPLAYAAEYNTSPPQSPSPASAEGGPSSGSAPTAPSKEAAEHESLSSDGSTWWTAFADPALDAVIEEALRNNYFFRDVRTLIAEGRLNPDIPRGPLWPLQINLPTTVQRSAMAAPAIPAIGQQPYSYAYNEWDMSIAASYRIDAFGKLDVQRRTAEDLVEQQQQSAEAFAQTLAEQVAQLWFDILERRALRALLERQVSYGEELLGIVKARFEQHLATRLAVLQQEQLLLSTRSALPLVDAQLALLNSRFTALLGRVPSLTSNLVPEGRRLPDLPPAPSVGTPADLFGKSPEVKFAQARVAEAEHLTSENLAGWLPNIDLFGNAGVQSFNFADTFPTANAGVRLTWPVFDGGQRIRRAAQLDLTVARRNWQLELAVNTAVQRVQEALLEEQKQADHLRVLHSEVELGERLLKEARQLFEQGVSDYLPVLSALENLSGLERATIQAQRLLLSYRVQLYHALGGTWSKSATKLTHSRQHHD